MFEGLVRWAGGAVFVLALLVCAYSFVAVGARSRGLTPRRSRSTPPSFRPSRRTTACSRATGQTVGDVRGSRTPVRSVYDWLASLLLIGVCAAWQPVGGEIYHLRGGQAMALAAVQLAGVLIIASAVRAMDALELDAFGPCCHGFGAISRPVPLGAPSALPRLAPRHLRAGPYDRRSAGIRGDLVVLPGHRRAVRRTILMGVSGAVLPIPRARPLAHRALPALKKSDRARGWG